MRKWFTRRVCFSELASECVRIEKCGAVVFSVLRLNGKNEKKPARFGQGVQYITEDTNPAIGILAYREGVDGSEC